MATRNETIDVKQRGQQTTNNRQASETGSETRSERERGLQTGREGRSQTNVVHSGTPGLGLTTELGAFSPFTLMRRMMDEMDRAFSPFFGGAGTDLWSDAFDGRQTLWSPAVEVAEKGDKLVVRAEIPGVSKDDVTVAVTDDALTIQGERRQESEDRGEGYYRSERSYGRFFRSIPLPDGVDTEKAEARFNDGVLEIALPTPKPEQKRGRKIAIR